MLSSPSIWVLFDSVIFLFLHKQTQYLNATTWPTMWIAKKDARESSLRIEKVLCMIVSFLVHVVDVGRVQSPLQPFYSLSIALEYLKLELFALVQFLCPKMELSFLFASVVG